MPEPTSEPEAQREEDGGEKSLIVTIAGRSEEALKRVYRELSENPRMAEAKERLEKVESSVLTSLHIASTEDVEAVRNELRRLEARVAELERAAGIEPKEPEEAPAEGAPAGTAGEEPAGA